VRHISLIRLKVNRYSHHKYIIIALQCNYFFSFDILSCCEVTCRECISSINQFIYLFIYLFAFNVTSSTHSLLWNLANSLLPFTARTAVQCSVEMSFATGTGLLRSQPFVTVSSAWHSKFVT